MNIQPRNVSTSAEAAERTQNSAIRSEAPRVLHVPSGEGQSVSVVGDTYTFKAVSENTNGQLFAWEASIPPEAGPPPHIHLHQFEAYYVLEGELEVLDDDRTFTARAGSFVYIPAGAVHAFRNRSGRQARMLIWMTPGGFENFFLEVGQSPQPGQKPPLPSPEEAEKMNRAAAKYGLEIIAERGA